MSPRSDPKARALEVCLQGIRSGVGLEQVLSAYPRWADELRPLLYTALAARSHTRNILAPELAQEHSCAGFLQVSQRMLPGVERPWIARLARLLLTLLVAGVLLSGGALLAERLALQALPGEWLYTLKLASEQLRSSMEKDGAQRLAMQLAYEEKRLQEVHALLQRAATAEVRFSGRLLSQQGAQWMIEDIPVTIPTNAQFVGDLDPAYHIAIQGTLQTDGSLLAKRVQVQEYFLEGTVQSISENLLVLADRQIILTTATLAQGAPLPGSHARVTLRLGVDGQLYARLIEALP